MATKSSQAGQLRVDPCSGAFTTVILFMMLSNRRLLTGGDIYLVCFNATVPTVLKTFCKAVFAQRVG